MVLVVVQMCPEQLAMGMAVIVAFVFVMRNICAASPAGAAAACASSGAGGGAMASLLQVALTRRLRCGD